MNNLENILRLRRHRGRGEIAATSAASRTAAVSTSEVASASSGSRSGRSARSRRGCRASRPLRICVRPRHLRKIERILTRYKSSNEDDTGFEESLV